MHEEPIRILLVEDSSIYAEFLQSLLEEGAPGQIDLTRATRLDGALRRLRDQSFDTILLDLGLPDSRGLDTFDRVHSEVPSTPIIILSILDSVDLALEAVQRGAQDYFIKEDVAGRLLARAIRYAMERKRAEEAVLETEKDRARLEGVTLSAREMADRMGNNLAVAMAILEILQTDRDLPSSFQDMANKAQTRLAAAAEDLKKLQRVTRVETKESPIGQALDLDRSTGWLEGEGYPEGRAVS
ncbi:MAG TPA: response regulator [Dehalococcoidia bacterium]|nr:response regulator [Dehalococcoidia bacterium]